jgi:hypothetical protein
MSTKHRLLARPTLGAPGFFGRRSVLESRDALQSRDRKGVDAGAHGATEGNEAEQASSQHRAVTAGSGTFSTGRSVLWGILMLTAFFMTGCGRAPTFDILGSFFPAWLACLALGVVLTAAARWILSRLHIAIAIPVLTYPSLTSLFACALWLALFR